MEKEEDKRMCSREGRLGFREEGKEKEMKRKSEKKKRRHHIKDIGITV